MHPFRHHALDNDSTFATESAPYSPLIVLLGLMGMIFSLVGNILEKQEMYPHFIREQIGRKDGFLHQIPVSLVFSSLSDILVCIYGLFIQDPVVVIYGLVNSVVILGTVLEIKMHTEDDDTMHFLMQ